MSHINLTIGKQIEDYEIFEKLGKGGFATVHRAKCRRSGLEVALKMIDRPLMHRNGMVIRVQKEVTFHSKLKHPSILQLYTYFEDANFVYLVLELAENGELKNFLKKNERTMTETQTANILMQIVEGLLYLKVNNIVHRDLSTANILLTRDFKVKIADFGLATDANEKHNTMCGTPNFISPEVLLRATHGIQVDVWGLGCIMYAMLVGQAPFEANDVKSTWARVMQEDVRIPDYISYEAKDLLSLLLRKNQNERIQIEDVPKHPFLAEYFQINSHSAPHLYAGASVDSGLLTMSSGMTSAQHGIGGRMENSRPQSGDRYCYQSNAPSMASNHVFDTLKRGHSTSSLCNRYDSVYSDSTAHQPLRAQSNELINRMGNMALGDKQIFSGIPSKPTFEYGLQNANNGARQYSANTPMPLQPLQENLCYGMQSNQMQNYEQLLSKQQQQQLLLQSIKPKLSVPPLNSERLLPTRFTKARTAIFNILLTGEVVVEFIKFKEKFNEERVTDVCRISKDGQRIVVYQPDAGRGLKIQNSPCEPPESVADKIFTYENLPAKHHKKYVYAWRFVQLVRAKTPKITYYSSLGKSDLMEDLDHFEIVFYGGEKIVRTSESNVTFLDSNQKPLTMNTENEMIRSLWAHYQQCYEHCKTLERAMNSIQCEGERFPIIVGRKSASAPILSVSKCNSNNVFSPQVASSLMSMNSVTSLSRPIQTKSSSMNRGIIEGVGDALTLPCGGTEITFSDGSRLSFRKRDQGGGVHFIDTNGLQYFYSTPESIPPPILRRLQRVQGAVEQKKNTYD